MKLSMVRHSWRPLGLCIFGGLLYGVGFCGFDQFYLSWICCVPILWVLDDDKITQRKAMLYGWVFGISASLSVYHWIVGTLVNFAYLPTALAVLGYVLLCVANGSALAMWAWLTHRTRRLGVSILWAAPVMMVLCEWLYPLLFPHYLANSQYRQIRFIQTADLWGVLGLTFIVTLGSCVVYGIVAWGMGYRYPVGHPRRAAFPRATLVALAALVVFGFLYGTGRMAEMDDIVAHNDRRVKVGMVQVNMGIYSKTESPAEGLRRHRKQSLELERQGAELIIWPESGYYYPIRQRDTNLKRQVMGPINTPLIFGALRLGFNPTRDNISSYNSAYAIDAKGDVLGSYDKNLLLVLGEYIPLIHHLTFLRKWFPHSSSFARGTHQRPLTVDGIDYGILICYEDLDPSFVRKTMQQKPDVLVNLTNDAWYGDSDEPRIHLALSIFRAVEQRRFLLRATNTGVSAFIDPQGRILQQTPTFMRANLLEEIVPLTVQTWYARLGEWFALLCLVTALFWWRRSIASWIHVAITRLRRSTHKS